MVGAHLICKSLFLFDTSLIHGFCLCFRTAHITIASGASANDPQNGDGELEDDAPGVDDAAVTGIGGTVVDCVSVVGVAANVGHGVGVCVNQMKS